MSVVESVQSFLDGLGGSAGDDPLAASALALAGDLDVVEMPCQHCGELTEQNRTSATARAMVAKELRETLSCLRALAPPVERKDELSELRSERAAGRRSAAT